MRKPLVAAIAATIVALAGCGGSPGTDIGGNSVKKSTSSVSSSSSSSSSSSEETPTTEDTPEGPQTFAIGEKATITQDGKDAATVVVTKIEVKTRPESQFGEKPKNGRFKFVTLVVRAIGTDTFDINPFDFYYRDPEGNKYEYGDGNAFMASDRNMINATTLNPKEQVKGAIVFDVSAKARELVYAPMQQSLALWKTP